MAQSGSSVNPLRCFSSPGVVTSNMYGSAHTGNTDHKLIALTGLLLFVVSAIIFLHVLTTVINKQVLRHNLGAARGATIQFFLRIIGYVVILLISLDLLKVSVGRLLLGSAVLGIVLGVAAQQALANFFASIVLILSHPLKVGEMVSLNSGALGGTFDGMITDIGLTHTCLRQDDGTIVLLPNTVLLSGTAIMAQKPNLPPDQGAPVASSIGVTKSR